MKRHRRNRGSNDPFRYPHRVEAWIQASQSAANGMRLLQRALLAQQLPHADQQHDRIARAAAALLEAHRWTVASLPGLPDVTPMEESKDG